MKTELLDITIVLDLIADQKTKPQPKSKHLRQRFVLHVFPRKTDKDGITTIAKFNKKKHKISLLTNLAHSNLSKRGFTVYPLNDWIQT